MISIEDNKIDFPVCDFCNIQKDLVQANLGLVRDCATQKGRLIEEIL